MIPSLPVLQYGSLAAWPYWLAEGLRSIGCPSINILSEESDVHDLNRRLPYHEALYKQSLARPLKLASKLQFLASIPSKFSLIHYHGDHLFRRNTHHLFEGRYLAWRKMPMLVSFGGSDARIIEMARARNPHFYRPADPARDEVTREYLRSISRHIRFAATDCEMAEYVEPYFEKVFTFRQPVDLARFQFVPPDNSRPPVFLHVPTEPKVKATEQIVAAFEQLRFEGLSFEFRLKRQLTQAEFYKELSTCDVYVDELRCGSHGVTAVEAMAAGKPTVTYIRPDLVKKYPPEMPLANANPDTILAVLRQLIDDPARRHRLGHDSRRYVERYHDSRVVAQDMLNVYQQIGLT